MFERRSSAQIEAALVDTPVIMVTGARQVGKSTIVRRLADSHNCGYVSLDDGGLLQTATADPQGFIGDLTRPVVVDEVQRVPGLMLAIKVAVDEARFDSQQKANGMFVLTGSSDIRTTLRASDSLAGRIERLQLLPLSQGEILGVKEDFITRLFTGKLPNANRVDCSRSAVSELVVRGGYPEVVQRTHPQRRFNWFENYIDTIIERDVRNVAQIHQLIELKNLLRILATRASGILNIANVAKDIGMPSKTVARYIQILEAVFLVKRVPAWRRNAGQRVIKSPKVWFSDTGLVAHLLRYDIGRMAQDDLNMAGALFENFVGLELQKQASWLNGRVNFYHYRTAGGIEVDIVLENTAGEICAVEVKLSSTVTPRDARGLAHFRDSLGDQFKTGVVIYTGRERIPLGDRIWALPATTLWSP